MKREVFFLIGANDTVLWSDASESALALPDSRARWEAIWSRRAELTELAHTHPVGPDAFSDEDLTTMEALDVALGKPPRFSLVTPHGYFVRAHGDAAIGPTRDVRTKGDGANAELDATSAPAQSDVANAHLDAMSSRAQSDVASAEFGATSGRAQGEVATGELDATRRAQHPTGDLDASRGGRARPKRAVRGEPVPAWTDSLRAHSGMAPFPRELIRADLRASLERWSASPPTDTARLEPLRAALAQHRSAIFVCTHNSRRSQLAQCIAWAAARWHGRAQHHFFSAGTEPGQVDPRSFAALARAGFGVDGDEVRLSVSEAPVSLTSKQLGDPSLPARFVATMVCSAADLSCPIVTGAAVRVSLPHEDPSVTGDFDGCAELIGRELVWALAP